MSAVNVMVNGRSYSIACDDGQEAHLSHLAAIVDAKIAELSAMVGQIGDSRLMLMAALVLADELDGLQKKAVEGEKTLAALHKLNDEIKSRADTVEGEAAAALESATKRVQDLLNVMQEEGGD